MKKDKDGDVDADERIKRRAGSVEEGRWIPGDPAAGVPPVRIPSSASPSQNSQHNLSALQPRSQVFRYSYI